MFVSSFADSDFLIIIYVLKGSNFDTLTMLLNDLMNSRMNEEMNGKNLSKKYELN